MESFKNYLKEGGNIKVGDHEAAPIDVAKHGRKALRGDVHDLLSNVHDTFHREYGKHLFGKNKKALETKTAYSGSSKHLMDDDIKDDDYLKHKSMTGDIDTQVPHEHLESLHSHLAPGKKFGKYTVLGSKKHGKEISTIFRHENGSHHQVDFEGSTYKNHEPSEFDRFAHSSDWHDIAAGVKGMHHKQLINAAGLDTHKFSITHGYKSREDKTKDVGETNPQKIAAGLFGTAADHNKMHSFHGVTQLIAKHVPPQHHQAIYDKMKEGAKRARKVDSSAALAHLRRHLNVRDTMNESAEAEEHHTTVIPMTGFAPHSHMGHAKDLGGAMHKLPGTKHVGISGKADAYSHEERKDILQRQWGKGVNAHVVKGAGETIRKGFDDIKHKKGKKVLNMLVGHDRKGFAEGLKKSLEAGKIKEMEGHKFDEIRIHHPEDTDRSHGMSGTNMRKAAHEGNIEEFHRHLGPMFSRFEAKVHMKKIQKGIKDGKIPLKR